MKKERKSIPLAKLSLNTGQVEWLPKNPRQWTQEQIDSMVRSLDEDPDFMEDRPPLVVPYEGRFIVFAGNERTEAEKRRKARTELDCMVYTPETDKDQETIIRRAMKDNGHFGSWDWDTLANEWGDFPLGDWGVPAWDQNAKDIDIDGLFDETKKAGKEKEIIIQVIVPDNMGEKAEDIRASIELTLDEFPGCKVK